MSKSLQVRLVGDIDVALTTATDGPADVLHEPTVMRSLELTIEAAILTCDVEMRLRQAKSPRAAAELDSIANALAAARNRLSRLDDIPTAGSGEAREEMMERR